jgi:hypothetical protein
MKLQQFEDNPFQLQLSFNLLIEHLESAATQTGIRADWAKTVLEQIALLPQLREGITDIRFVDQNAKVISNLLAELFPAALTLNEIKAVTIPFQDILINQTQRFKDIIAAAGPSFDISIRDFTNHQFYIMSCCMILGEYYDKHFNFSKPLYYDIPDKNGIVKHYRILYNGDFMEIVPTPQALTLTPEDIDLLRDNYDDLALWKKYFPANSWILKGFAIVTLYDATVENAVSALKGTLLSARQNINIKSNILSVFRSIFKIADLQIGLAAYSEEENKLSVPSFNHELYSYILAGKKEEICDDTLCDKSLDKLIQQNDYYAVSDVDKLVITEPQNLLAKRFRDQGIKSFILAPVIKNNYLLGVIEVVSVRANELNSINANQLDVVMPSIIDTLDRQFAFMMKSMEAVIQNEYTAIHPSVYWKFKREANKFIEYRGQGKDYALKEITFTDVYPLYGQIDIKGSTETRNTSVQLDLQDQLTAALQLLEQMQKNDPGGLEHNIEALSIFVADVKVPLRADTEQIIQNYLAQVVHPLLKKNSNAAIQNGIDNYFKDADSLTGDFHLHRRKYDTTVSLINEKMSIMLDKWQVQAQEMFPHYYERFKTDGIEHNLYIGNSIAPTRNFNFTHLYNLRLWQLQTLCNMEFAHHRLKTTLPYPLEVTSLILAFSSPLSIRFRMDEKRFDVDGTYNARFEMVKKRIDKAFIKNSTERITTVGKITIVYSNAGEEQEYLRYISFLQSKDVLSKDLEMLDVEDLQGISGLKALRAQIIYGAELPQKHCYSYQDMLDESQAISQP